MLALTLSFLLSYNTRHCFSFSSSLFSNEHNKFVSQILLFTFLFAGKWISCLQIWICNISQNKWDHANYLFLTMSNILSVYSLFEPRMWITAIGWNEENVTSLPHNYRYYYYHLHCFTPNGGCDNSSYLKGCR